MKKRNAGRKETVALSGFGAALTLMASGLAIGAEPQAPMFKPMTPTIQAMPLAAPRVVLKKSDLCRIGDVNCMMAKPFARKLAAAQQAQLKVLISRNVQVDIKDACLLC